VPNLLRRALRPALRPVLRSPNSPREGGGAPINTVRPAAPSGNAWEGQTLTADSGTWTGSGITYSYQWWVGDPVYSGFDLVTSGGDFTYTNKANVGGATASTYVRASADRGKVLGVTVTATNASGAVSVDSYSVGPGPAGAIPGAIGSGGALPTGYSTPAISGLTYTVSDVGSYGGLPGFKLRIAGTPGATTGFNLAGASATAVAAAQGQLWRTSTRLAMTAGSTTNLSALNHNIISERGAAGANLSTESAAAGSITGSSTLFTNDRTLTNASCQFILPKVVQFNVTNGLAVDVTYEIVDTRWVRIS